MSKGNIRALPTIQSSEIGAAAEKLKRNMQEIREFNTAIAQIQREAYLAYVKQGFTAAQALELVKGIR